MQPWHFVVVSNPEIKKKIRIAAEEEEKEFYTKRAPKEWLEVLEPLGTDENKPFLETAPHLIAIFLKVMRSFLMEDRLNIITQWNLQELQLEFLLLQFIMPDWFHLLTHQAQ